MSDLASRSFELVDVDQSAVQLARLRWWILRHRVPGHQAGDASRHTLAASRVRLSTIAGLTAVWSWPPTDRYSGDPGFVTLWSRDVKVAECRYKMVNRFDGHPAGGPVLLATNLRVEFEWRRGGIATAILSYLLQRYPGSMLAGETMNDLSAAVHAHVAGLLPGRVHDQQTHRPGDDNLNMFETHNKKSARHAARYRRRQARRRGKHTRLHAAT